MQSLRHYLSTRSLASNSSQHSVDALNEPEILKEAMISAGLILNDDIEGAELELSKGTSSYHKLGKGVVTFLRSVLGFEQETMRLAADQLSEAETAASEMQRRAHRGETYRSAIYPPGSEYALCYAEAQLMAAVIGVLNESLTEAVKGFYRLRKAYTTLQEIAEAETRFLAGYKQPEGGRSSGLAKSKRDPADDDSDSDLEFVDADDDATHHGGEGADGYEGHLADDMADLKVDDSVPLSTDRMPAAALTNPVDLFVHTGMSLCFGALQLLLSMVPPTFSRLLSIVGFRGSRTAGLKMLWAAAEHTDHINGGIAALVLLSFYNNLLGICDIVYPDAQHQAKCQALLADMRKRYPKGKFWLLEEAREVASDKRPEEAIQLLMGDGTTSPLKQMEALRLFELSLNHLYTSQYEKCANGFIKCTELNNWSHGLYFYIAGCSYVELYRAATDEEQKERYKSRATELMNTVPTKTGKKRFMARQLPFDAFVSRKHTKWTALAEKQGCSMIDAIGVSPAEEIGYFWGTGNKRRNSAHLAAALERVEWFRGQGGGAEKDDEAWAQDTAHDEVAAYRVLRAVLLERLGRREEAHALLNKVVAEDSSSYKSKLEAHAENWPPPVARYELAVCAWDDYLKPAGKEGSSSSQAHLEECGSWLEKVAKWEAYDLDTRIGMKVRTGQETLRRLSAEGASISS